MTRRAPLCVPTTVLALLLSLFLSPEPVDAAASLTPSRSALMRQVRAADSHEYTFLATPADVRRFLERGLLVPVPGNADYRVKDSVDFPYARPEVRLFVERLGRQYRRACGHPLVVTSLVRPESRQPWNSSRYSVHPTGMALDLRVSRHPACRTWLGRTLLTLERNGVLEAARERHPPHFHVVLFPRPYVRYLRHHLGVDVSEELAQPRRYRVRPGDTLWRIARRHGTSVGSLRHTNGLRSDRLRPGQVLTVPTR